MCLHLSQQRGQLLFTSVDTVTRLSVRLGLVVVSFNAFPEAPQALFVKKKAIGGSAQDWSCQL